MTDNHRTTLHYKPSNTEKKSHGFKHIQNTKKFEKELTQDAKNNTKNNYNNKS